MSQVDPQQKSINLRSFDPIFLGRGLGPYLVESAKRLAAEGGLEHRIQFQAGGTHSLERADRIFSRVRLGPNAGPAGGRGRRLSLCQNRPDKPQADRTGPR